MTQLQPQPQPQPPVPRPPAGGSARAVPPGSLLFSMTDLTGAITALSADTADVAGFRAEDLLGIPYSALRHPSVPAGVFQHLWRRLAEGRPAVVLLDNLGRDGRSYRLMTGVVVVGGEALSVQLPPRTAMAHLLRQAAVEAARVEASLIADPRMADSRMADSRMADPRVADAGAEALEVWARARGYRGYAQLAADALIAEVAARYAALARQPGAGRPWSGEPGSGELEELEELGESGAEVFGTVSEVLGATRALEGRLSDLMARSMACREAAVALDLAVRAVTERVEMVVAAVEAARDGAPPPGGGATALISVADAMARVGALAAEQLQGALADARHVEQLAASVQTRAALARLQADAGGSLIVASPGQVLPSGIQAVWAVGEALRWLVAEIDARVRQLDERLRSLTRATSGAAASLADAGSLMGTWGSLWFRSGLAGDLDRHLAPVERHLAGTRESLAAVEPLVQTCRRALVPLDRAVLDAELVRVRAAVIAARG